MSSSQQPSTNALSLVGTVVADRYRIDALLGEGGMGAVYRAEHVHMRKVVALKVLHQHMTLNDEAVRRFEREAIAAGRIEHPNVAQATDFGRLENGSFYLVLEYVAGTSLSAVLDREGSLEPSRAAHIAAQIASALVAAHAEGIVHRDLKPENVMLAPSHDGTDRVKVLDFGIAKLEFSSGQLTQLGTVFGTPQYMAPEQAAGCPVDARADIYALGLILHEMLAGEPTFHSDDLLGLLTQQMTAAPPPLPPGIPEPLKRLVASLLEKEPERRVQSAVEARGALLQSLSRQQRKSLESMRAGPMRPYEPQRPPPSSGARSPELPSPVVDGTLATVAAGQAASGPGGVQKASPARALALAIRTLGGSIVETLMKWAPIVAPRIVRWLPPSLRARLEPLTDRHAAALLAVLGLGAGIFLGWGLYAAFSSKPAADAIEPGAEPTEESDDDLDESLPPEQGTASPESPELESVIQLASRGSAPALYALTQRDPAKRTAREWLALAQGRLIRKELAVSLEAFGHAVEKRPALAANKAMLAGLRYFGSKDASCDSTLEFAAKHLGTSGADLLFEVWSSTSLKTRATEKAWALLQQPAQRSQMTPALALALDVRAAQKCEDYARLLPRMAAQGDERSYRILKQLVKETGCGPNERDDCFPCLRGSNLLNEALTQTRLRKAPKYDSRRWR